ncbi:DUF3298 and DUF4163 domain-containing protein [Arachidicoccus terrestris]|uniref:DUF3298 and DUF4163 domain-containing protein n=1 Tax=Arachidicoccus terrestris TaxID=2875539 RepID=UPI001CC6EB9A|nr:DUF3298 and DUF4163 domain-containing protein [Arachidicoccus terrestris]UAY56961.1 DUF3298 and DUF4163 domain-containing protein [Arachidicoccus terrestris]
MKSITALLIVVCFCFCIPDKSVAQKKPFPYNVYKCFTGQIGGQPVHVYLRSNGGRVNGWYTYDGFHKAPTAVRYAGQKSTDSLLVLIERAKADDGSSSPAQWEVTYHDSLLTGSWKSPGRTKADPIELKENYPPGTYPFIIEVFNHTYDAYPEKDSTPQWETTYVYPVASSKDSNGRWMNHQIKILLDGDTSQTFDSIIHGKVSTGLQQYRKDMQGSIGKAYSSSMNYESFFQIDIDYNKNDYLVLPAMVYAFTGGAHGNYATTYACYDVRHRKQLHLSDVLQADSTTIRHLIESQYRVDQHLKPGDRLTDIYDNTLPVTDNFYFNDIGMCFVYNPYEVAPYAKGTIEVIIPYEKLNTFLNPDFKKRMGLR